MSGRIIFNLCKSLASLTSRRLRRGNRQAFRELAVETLEDRRVLAAAQLSGTTYTQNFNSLASSGNTAVTGGLFPDGANALQGWAFAELGSNANTSYAADSGLANAGDTYSFAVTGSTDRAFGTLRSSSLISTIGASFQNATNASLDSIRVSYTGEQWRLGATGRNDLLNFQFSTNATSLTTGTWTDVNDLDFVAPVTTGTLGARDGNAAVNRLAFSNILLPGLTLAPAATFWIRWTDFSASGADDGLAIDDFSISTSGTASAGISVIETGGASTVTEGGATDTYSIALQSAPTANVTITINPGSQVMTSASTLTFTPINWATAQVVTITAVNDAVVEGTHFGTITHTASSSDTAYNAIPIPSLTVTITDNDGTPTTTNLRVVSYNIASSNGSIRTGLDTILQGIGSEIVAGFERQLDLIALQEVDIVQTATSTVASLLNAIYGAGIYVSGTLAGLTSGSGTPGVVYNSQTLQLLGEIGVGTISSSGQARQTLRYHFQPIGGGANTDFYVYNSHWKGEDDTESEGRRLIEAQAIRSNSNALGNGKNILYVGDMNVYRSSDDGFQQLLGAGNGQAFDPINRLGNWNSNASFKDIHTQAPLVNAPSGLIGGGLDDRFDFQLNSGELTDGAGLEFRTGSYHTFGNNGSVPFNGDINDSSSTALSGLANRITLLNRLSTVSDHLPVVADYTFSTFTDTTPPTVTIDDGDADNSGFVNSPLNYTLTFSEDILNGSVTAADFNNAGTANISIGAITENTPGVFSIMVTPTNAGTIILRIPTGAVISDLAGNNLVVPVQDGDTVTAVALANPTIVITSGNRTYNNSVYVATASITGTNSPQPTLSFVYYSNAGGTNVISAPENFGTYFVRAFAAANAGNNAAQSTITQFQITSFVLTGSITAANKVFDGTTAATILTRSLVEVFSGDTVNYIGGTATFATSTVGSGIVVTATGLNLSGADADNYSVNNTATTTANITVAASVVNRRVFYNGGSGGATGFGASTNFSATSGNPAATAIDSKVALLPGQNSSFANITNVSFGLNGIIVDIANPAGTITAADFSFATGMGAGSSTAFTTLDGAALTAVNPQMTQYVGDGTSGSTRAKITFENNSLRNIWLKVTVLANSNTGLAANDVFYFGNVVGDVNGSVSSGRYTVNAIDTSGVRNPINQSTVPNSVLVTNIYDLNKTGNVNAIDTSVVRANQQASGIVRAITNSQAGGIGQFGGFAKGDAPAITTKGSQARTVETLQAIEPMTISAVTKTAVSNPSADRTDTAVMALFVKSKPTVLEKLSQTVGSIDDYFAQLGGAF